ncbi:hypothetical protein LTR16_002294 [Cryomyces antarcticus]|uniref:SRR1-like domain-containing protein n=1 Tax=Cryomyces antarcticus TaxID=329879 RepID=A0ABR0M7N2_9PEZI|nr:hypothetical protein LTR60_001468 [Cryomyces antarcticus]KAK5291145.1 hypothetical protein LTR16_002294 [Cryomyces antarcticus]
MPHSTRRNKNSSRAKRIETTTSDGWTVVAHTNPSASVRNRSERETPTGVRSILPDLTLGRLKSDYDRARAQWQDGECHTRLTGILSKMTRDVEHAVCLGVGSFSVDTQNRWRSLWQLVAFTSIVSALSKGSTSIKIWAQDPCFTSLDTEFLESLGVTVVQHPQAKQHITEKTFLYAPFVDWSITLDFALDETDPSLYIGTDIKQIMDTLERISKAHEYDCYTSEEKAVDTDHYIAIAERFCKGRDVCAFPKYEGQAYWQDGLKIYWKEEAEED